MSGHAIEWTDPSWILALMHFPHDERSRKRYLAVRMAEQSLSAKETQTFELTREALESIVDAAMGGVWSSVEQTAKRGIVAGDVLMVMYAMHAAPWELPAPSFGRAIDVIKRFASDPGMGAEYADGAKLPRSDRIVRECISEFRSVAHLWGAFRLHQAFPLPTQLHEDLLRSREGARALLGIARTLQEFGVSFVPQLANPPTSILDPANIWRVPDTVPKFSLRWPADPPPWLIDTIQSYKA